MRRSLKGYRTAEVDHFLDRCVSALGVAVSRFPELSSRPVRSPRGLAPVTADDVARVEFPISFRGYSLQEVDELLERVEAELRRSS